MILEKISYLDEKILTFINTKCRNRFFDLVMPFATALGNLGIVWITLAILLIRKANYRRMGIVVIVALIFTTIIGEGIIKHIVRRKRPYNYHDRELIIKEPSTYSFPSGHTASSFAVATLFLRNYSQISIVIAVIALTIAFSRLYLDVHYPSDVLGGAVLGSVCGWIVFSYFF